LLAVLPGKKERQARGKEGRTEGDNKEGSKILERKEGYQERKEGKKNLKKGRKDTKEGRNDIKEGRTAYMRAGATRGRFKNQKGQKMEGGRKERRRRRERGGTGACRFFNHNLRSQKDRKVVLLVCWGWGGGRGRRRGGGELVRGTPRCLATQVTLHRRRRMTHFHWRWTLADGEPG
jgi:hypothetical protein